MPKYIDIHCHLSFKVFNEDYDSVIQRALENDTWLINVGTQIDTSKKAVEIAHQYNEGVYAIIGLHPIHTSASYHDEQELGPAFAKASDGQGKEEGFVSRGEVLDKKVYTELLRDPKVVAIGECGLDYFRAEPDLLDKQRKAFIEQIEIANEVGKPLMLHIRDAYADTLQILKEHAKVKGVVHFFAGNLEDAKGFLELGFLLSFTGAITYPPKKDGSGSDYQEIIKNVPLDMILTDTDSPYVAPIPYRGKRNEPSYVKEIVKKIAEIKGLSEEEVAQAVVANAKRLFTF
ncbi:hydrolase TatD [Candidatus Nomurabacteria bacterium CG10_big_fil_rev_8_21_14_0_10_35_16]|uniref:Hydrolase TatD n=1 Tax=Candidatus Nomurabacteria bacterium CG10_big_fil_rev_8_21_14_0_10_35_16 TaxID=1974731 RepID=A0A2H0TC19_9BACT|nr:MAG: hydrolase TatD [Candidatus Nomurabacteria bacterium CG10_big_fil_rev_8_21_14_0_10_35_16]